MSTIRDRLTALHRRGHQRPLGGLHDDAPFFDDGPPRPAAVLIAVTERDGGDGPGVLMIERPSVMRRHAGQVAFPGGAIDPGEGPVEAALREAHEEIALPPSRVHVIGETDLFHSGTGFAITPVLATVPPDLSLRANPAEVDEWFEVPLAFLFDPANHGVKEGRFNGRTRNYIEMNWSGHRIWGITAKIIVNLAKRLDWRDAAS